MHGWQGQEARINNPTERSLASRFFYYVLALLLFAGVTLVYRSDNPTFDVVSGLLIGLLIYAILRMLNRASLKDAVMLSELKKMRDRKYLMSQYFRLSNVLAWVVPILILPYLLYQSDYPRSLIKFACGFFTSIILAYVQDFHATLSFYKGIDAYIDWEKIDRALEKRG